MARIIFCHPSQTKYDYHIYTDLDFWDAVRLLRGLADVRRNFGTAPSGDEFPTQIVGTGLGRSKKKEIEKRLGRAIVSPPRHVIVDAMIRHGSYEFDPSPWYPAHWSKSRVLHFTYHRLPLQQSSLNTPHKTVRLSVVDGKIRVERVQRGEKYDPVVRSKREAMRRLMVPSCF
jgi:hypothetical protein